MLPFAGLFGEPSALLRMSGILDKAISRVTFHSTCHYPVAIDNFLVLKSNLFYLQYFILLLICLKGKEVSPIIKW